MNVHLILTKGYEVTGACNWFNFYCRIVNLFWIIDFHFCFVAMHQKFEIIGNYSPGLNLRRFHLFFKHYFPFYFSKILKAWLLLCYIPFSCKIIVNPI
jgi:hypothetical protein